jgi:hypothetical protein
MDSQKPAAQITIDNLREIAKDQKDHDYLDAEQVALEAERQKTLGVIATPNLIEQPDGLIVTASELSLSEHRGEHPSGPYDGKNRQ